MKKQWNTLKIRIEPQRHRETEKDKRDFFFLSSKIPSVPQCLCGCFLMALCLLVFSCAPKYLEKPSREGIPLPEILAKMNTVQSIEAVLSIDYEKNDATMSGDAFLKLSPVSLDLRIYYLGFLAGEVKEDNGVIKSKPRIDKYKSIVLVDGLRNSFLWWTMSDYTIQETEDSYVLRNFSRKLIISKKSLLPVEQTIELDNGEEMTISYDEPASNKTEMEKNGLDPEIAWYQSRLSIRYRNHQVKVRVKSYTPTIQKTAQQQLP